MASAWSKTSCIKQTSPLAKRQKLTMDWRAGNSKAGGTNTDRLSRTKIAPRQQNFPTTSGASSHKTKNSPSNSRLKAGHVHTVQEATTASSAWERRWRLHWRNLASSSTAVEKSWASASTRASLNWDTARNPLEEGATWEVFFSSEKQAMTPAIVWNHI